MLLKRLRVGINLKMEGKIRKLKSKSKLKLKIPSLNFRQIKTEIN